MGKTDMLYAVPSFIGGLATTLDMGGTLSMYNESESPDMADAKALTSDWLAVAEDMRSALNTAKEEYVKE